MSCSWTGRMVASGGMFVGCGGIRNVAVAAVGGSSCDGFGSAACTGGACFWTCDGGGAYLGAFGGWKKDRIEDCVAFVVGSDMIAATGLFWGRGRTGCESGSKRITAAACLCHVQLGFPKQR